VDITDLGVLASFWQTSGFWRDGDFDYSGLIDITDLGLLASNWQAGVAIRPEPAGRDPGAFDHALASLGLSAAAVPDPLSDLAGCAMSALSLGFMRCRRNRIRRTHGILRRVAES
jgi:hypothetical protein